jgi:hypothetical protein
VVEIEAEIEMWVGTGVLVQAEIQAEVLEQIEARAGVEVNLLAGELPIRQQGEKRAMIFLL